MNLDKLGKRIIAGEPLSESNITFWADRVKDSSYSTIAFGTQYWRQVEEIMLLMSQALKEQSSCK